MSAILKTIVKDLFEEDVDGVAFFPKDNDSLDLRGFEYRNKGKYVTSELGNYYHIMIYKLNDKGFLIDRDNFEAILTDPYVYTSNLILSGFYGVVVKKTKKSKKFIDELYEKFANDRPIPAIA